MTRKSHPSKATLLWLHSPVAAENVGQDTGSAAKLAAVCAGLSGACGLELADYLQEAHFATQFASMGARPSGVLYIVTPSISGNKHNCHGLIK